MEHGFDSRRRYQKSSSFDEDFFVYTPFLFAMSTEFVHIAKAME